MLKQLKNFSEEAMGVLFPNSCAGCCEIIPNGEFFCDYCFEMLEKCDKDKLCIKCGMSKKQCRCKRFVYSFNGIVAPLYNVGIARKAMLRFKFYKYSTLKHYFSQQMALSVTTHFKDADFDYICYVPMNFLKRARRRYNQSRLLAHGLSKILRIPVVDGALGVKYKRNSQHDLKLKYRFENVKNMYYGKCNLKGKNILLVDDICTSGATLDACSRALLKSGAENVYCVTAVISKREEKKNGK